MLTVEFTVAGVHFLGLNGGPEFKHNEAFSFQIATDDQAMMPMKKIDVATIEAARVADASSLLITRRVRDSDPWDRGDRWGEGQHPTSTPRC